MLRLFVLNIYKCFLNCRLSLKSIVILFGYIFKDKSSFVSDAPNSCDVLQLKHFILYYANRTCLYLFQLHD